MRTRKPFEKIRAGEEIADEENNFAEEELDGESEEEYSKLSNSSTEIVADVLITEKIKSESIMPPMEGRGGGRKSPENYTFI